MRLFLFIFILFFTQTSLSKGLNIYGLGIYDVKLDGSETNQVTDIRIENRFDKNILDMGPKEDNFFFLKPFVGLEATTDSAYYILTGIYLEDNLGQLFTGNESNLYFTPSFGLGYYDNGSGKDLGNDLQFRTSFEMSYELENKNRIGISFSHISNANLGDKNPGVETLSISYQIPY